MSTFKLLSPEGYPLFLASLAGECSDVEPIHRLVRNEQELQRFVTKHDEPGRQSYFAVAHLSPPWRNKVNVSGSCWVWAEIDFKDHPGLTPEQILERIHQIPLKPNLIVFSGHGYHIYWRLPEPTDARYGEAQREFEQVLELACVYVSGDPNVVDASRLMRLPGSHNTRFEGESIPVEVIHRDNLSHELDDLRDFFLEARPILPPRVLPEPKKKSGNGAAHSSAPLYVPIDVDTELATLSYKGVRTGRSINECYKHASCTLLRAGFIPDEFADMWVAAVMACAEREGHSHWTREKEYVRVNDSLKSTMRAMALETPDDLPWLTPEQLEAWHKAKETGRNPALVHRGKSGWRIWSWSGGEQEHTEILPTPKPNGNGEHLGGESHSNGESARAPEDQTPPPRSRIRRPEFYSAAEFTHDFTPPDYLIDGVVQLRFLYSFTGMTGHGKTAVLLLIAALVALERAINGHEVRAGHVLVLAGENPDDVRMRWMAMAEHFGFDQETIKVHFMPGVFPIADIKQRAFEYARKCDIELCLVIVDTSAAYFPGNDENSNTQMGAHARTLRGLVDLPGGPCVLVSCHPLKNADLENLLPRGGGAFLNEMDGNLICRKSGEDVSEVHWHGKHRGADFAPMFFLLQSGVTCAKLVDSKERPIPTVMAKALNDSEHSSRRTESLRQEDDLLIALIEAGDEELSLAAMAMVSRWFDKKGVPDRSRAQRVLKRLCKDKFVKVERGRYELTETGKKAAQKAKSKRTQGFGS